MQPASSSTPGVGAVSQAGSSALSGQSAASNVAVPASTGAATSSTQKRVVREETDAERSAYNSAYGLVKEKKFKEAIKAFHEFIDAYPESRLAGNAYYWLGEVYLVLPQLEQAQQAFSIVVQAYQGHAKAADALYKLGVTLDRLEKPKESERYLLEVQKLYPDSTAARLAKSYKINR